MLNPKMANGTGVEWGEGGGEEPSNNFVQS